MRIGFALLLLSTLVGCAQERAYRITVRNKTSETITVGFVKDGPPLESRWASPEEMSDLPLSRRPDRWGIVVRAGEKASTGVTGKFEGKTGALLRIYLGDRPIDELMAMSRGMGDRTEVKLTPQGDNDFTVRESDGQIEAKLTRLSPRN